MDSEPFQFIEGENNKTLTDLLQNHNSEEEFDNFTLNFDKHSPYYDHKSFLTFLQDNDKLLLSILAYRRLANQFTHLMFCIVNE